MPPFDVYSPDPNRYDGRMPYRRTGQSGLKLPAISLGFWHNFGDDKPIEKQRAIMRKSFDLGITHFDLANNYGPPYGSAEVNAGRILREDFSGLRDELVISSKAGWDMWLGPYGDLGSRKHILASLDQSLQRLGLEYVDIFYHHRPDPETPVPIGRLGDDFPAMLEDWHRLSVAINALNRSMGAEDPYPFVITRAVEEKLEFVHRIIARARHAAAR